MSKIKKCLNEWNAAVEALAQGKQTIIRKYCINLVEFFLFQQQAMLSRTIYQESFKDRSFAEDNALLKKGKRKKEVKYYAKG